ncbi:hypothetical protein HDK64DRAFT_139316 [Phyllosticta capitalensis]
MCSTPKRGNTWCIRNRRDAASSHATLSASHGDDSLPLYHQLVFDIFPSASLMSHRRRRPIHHDEAPSATDTTPYTSNTMFIASAANCAVFAIIIIHVISSWQQKKKKKRERMNNFCTPTNATPARRAAPHPFASARLASSRIGCCVLLPQGCPPCHAHHHRAGRMTASPFSFPAKRCPNLFGVLSTPYFGRQDPQARPST